MNRSILGAAALAGILCAAQPVSAQSWNTDAIEGRAGAEAYGRAPPPSVSLSRDETSWHVRAALNVAALGCRDMAEAQTIASYNNLLARHRAPLAAADTQVKAEYRARHGAVWESRHDHDMTRVYNLFARPWAHGAFCAEAQAVLAEAESVEPQEFADFAAYALPRLEAPFMGVRNVHRLGETASIDRRALEIPLP
ncbi:hypothetical protein [Sphingomonas sp.]|jgi:hypothetical protein|uniref:hypothetical protein n=1 Tax=Sphingomonas sp. TaxID=28214 RepID=UPI002ED96655